MSIVKCAALSIKNIKQAITRDYKDLNDLLSIRTVNRAVANGFSHIENGQKVNQAFSSLKGKLNAVVNGK